MPCLDKCLLCVRDKGKACRQLASEVLLNLTHPTFYGLAAGVVWLPVQSSRTA